MYRLYIPLHKCRKIGYIVHKYNRYKSVVGDDRKIARNQNEVVFFCWPHHSTSKLWVIAIYELHVSQKTPETSLGTCQTLA